MPGSKKNTITAKAINNLANRFHSERIRVAQMEGSAAALARFVLAEHSFVSWMVKLNLGRLPTSSDKISELIEQMRNASQALVVRHIADRKFQEVYKDGALKHVNDVYDETLNAVAPRPKQRPSGITTGISSVQSLQ